MALQSHLTEKWSGLIQGQPFARSRYGPHNGFGLPTRLPVVPGCSKTHNRASTTQPQPLRATNQSGSVDVPPPIRKHLTVPVTHKLAHVRASKGAEDRSSFRGHRCSQIRYSRLQRRYKPSGISSPPSASNSAGRYSRNVSIIRVKLASCWPRSSSPPSCSA